MQPAGLQGLRSLGMDSAERPFSDRAAPTEGLAEGSSCSVPWIAGPGESWSQGTGWPWGFLKDFRVEHVPPHVRCLLFTVQSVAQHRGRCGSQANQNEGFNKIPAPFMSTLRTEKHYFGQQRDHVISWDLPQDPSQSVLSFSF